MLDVVIPSLCHCWCSTLIFLGNLIRLEKQLTQEKVAEAADLHPNYIGSVERGERNISICNIERIATARSGHRPRESVN